MLGWKLLLLLSQQAVPRSDIVEFVVCFYKQAIESNRTDQDRLEIADIAKECFKALEQSLEQLEVKEQEALGYTTNVSPKESDSLKKSHSKNGSGEKSRENTVKIEVFLMDNSARKLRCKRHTTVGELGNKMAELLRVCPENAVGFGFFQLVDDVIETHRIVPDNVALGDLSDKWVALYQKNGKHSRLLWKRQFLLRTENIVANDQAFATLTFKQAYFEFLRYPVGWLAYKQAMARAAGANIEDGSEVPLENIGLFHHIACCLLSLEPECFNEYIKARNLVGRDLAV